MSRSTQFIGLTEAARRYVKNAERRELYEMTSGMFGEPIMGTIYHMTPPAGPNAGYYLKEVVQDTPWSSGPMIFTRLKPFLVKECGQVLGEDEEGGEYFSWVLDPTLKDEHMEVDQTTGRYYV